MFLVATLIWSIAVTRCRKSFDFWRSYSKPNLWCCLARSVYVLLVKRSDNFSVYTAWAYCGDIFNVLMRGRTVFQCIIIIFTSNTRPTTVEGVHR